MDHLSSLLPVPKGNTTLPFLRFSRDKVKTQESFHKPLGRFPLTWVKSSEVWTVSVKIPESWQKNTMGQFKTLSTNLVTDEGAESWSVPKSYRSLGAISLLTYTTLGGEALNLTSGEVFHSRYFISLFCSFISEIKGRYWLGMLHSSPGAAVINLIL